ncbi:MAG: oligosaccharyl transferase, archaeosortase A system-associated [Candidatus Syntropharchaeia archaeon]
MNLSETLKKKTSIIVGGILLIFFTISFYIRTVLPYDAVFRPNSVRFASDDAVYHMRLVENMLHHFPHRIIFDPYTYFPHGRYVPFAPLYDYMIGFTTWIIGLGHPSRELMLIIGAYFPAILGSLVIFPVYFIGKEIYDRKVGLISAGLITILPGQFLSRSVLGFTDHHVAEVLFSTIFIMFLIMAIKRSRDLTFDDIRKKDLEKLKIPGIYVILTGIALGFYILVWVGALIFVFIVFTYAVVQHLIDHLRGRDTDYLSIVLVPSFLIALIMILPFLTPASLTPLHVISLCVGVIGFLMLTGISRVLRVKKVDPYAYPFVLLIIGIFALIALNIVYPQFLGKFSLFRPSGGMLSVAEVTPLLSDHPGDPRGLKMAWTYFGITLYFSYIALALIAYDIIKKWDPGEVFLFIWSVIGLALMGALVPFIWNPLGQNRFAYYFAVNASILSGFFIMKVVGFGLKQEVEESKKKRKIGVDHLLVTFIIIFAVFYPFPLNIGNPYPANMPEILQYTITTAIGGPHSNDDWYEALNWMRENTPDPFGDPEFYYAYYEPPLPGKDYDYPDSAYGVMAWWDYGHVITWIAHRIPNANPFQSGIGGPQQGGDPGACTFLSAQSEEEANNVLDELGSRYVITDSYISLQAFGAVTTWAEKEFTPFTYYNSMMQRLHIFDGRGFQLTETYAVPPLKHYRLIHESPTTTPLREGDMIIKWVKIFEYVKGAKIYGNAQNGSIVSISTNVTTNQNRSFTYSQMIKSNGSFSFIVPYSTEGPIEGETQFDVYAEPYILKIGNLVNDTLEWKEEKTIHVNETQVLEGLSINANEI